MELRTAVQELGATDAQLNSKVFAMAEQAVADGSVDGLSDVRKSVKMLEGRVNDANDSISSRILSARSASQHLESIVKDAREAIGDLSGAVDEVHVGDETIRDAVNAYTLILTRTKQVLGEDAMTEAVICQLLETASYGLWRSIMGPKEQPSSRKWAK